MKIGFIGAGNMGEALLAGIIKSNKLQAKNIFVYDADPSKNQEISNKYQVKSVASNQELLKLAQIVILAIKPNVYPLVLPEIATELTDQHHLLSLAPGFDFAKLNNLLNKSNCKLSLIMSNTSAGIGQAVTAACFGDNVAWQEKAQLTQLFESIGDFFEVAEDQMPTITSVIGSVPALVYMVIEGIMQGAILEGISADQAKHLAANIVASAANMVTESDEHPAILRDKICSPGGTTIEGVAHMQSSAFEGKIIEAIQIMAEKARKMKS